MVRLLLIAVAADHRLLGAADPARSPSPARYRQGPGHSAPGGHHHRTPTRKDPRVPRRARLAVAFAGLSVVSPIDLIPEFLPVIGPLDDVVVVALALR